MIGSNPVLDAVQVFFILEFTLSKGHGKEQGGGNHCHTLSCSLGGGASPCRGKKNEGEREGRGEEPKEMPQKSWELPLEVPSFSPWHKQSGSAWSLLVGGRYLELNIHR